MVVPEYQDGKSEGNYLLKKITAKSPQKSTRQAGIFICHVTNC